MRWVLYLFCYLPHRQQLVPPHQVYNSQNPPPSFQSFLQLRLIEHAEFLCGSGLMGCERRGRVKRGTHRKSVGSKALIMISEPILIYRRSNTSSTSMNEYPVVGLSGDCIIIQVGNLQSAALQWDAGE
jgi:hypothetical protein